MTSLGQWLGGGRRGGGGGGDLDAWFGSPFSSDLWDPLAGGGGQGDDTTALALANIDWLETDKAHIFRADLPGVRKEEVKDKLEDGNIFQISGERNKEEQEDNDKWHRVERRRGSFTRRFHLPENAKLDEVKCKLENGVLTVTVPKKEKEETPRNARYIDVA